MRLRPSLLTAALACLLVLAGCGDRSDDAGGGISRASDGSSAVETPAGPDTSIPDDFPLAAGMGAAGDSIATTRTGTGLRDLELCGTSPLRGLGERDRMVADNSGGEALSTRELVLLGSPDRAAEVARSLSDLPASCRDAARNGTWETRTEVRGSPFGPSPAAVLVQTRRVDGEPTPGALVINVVPAGAALLVTQEYGEWTDVDDGLAAAAGSLGETVAALQGFADDAAPTGTPTPTETPTEETTGETTEEPTEETTGTPTEQPTGQPTGQPTAERPVTEVPADLPLADGLPDADAETTVYGPEPDPDVLGEVEMCGRVVWPYPDGTDAKDTERRLAAAAGPEWSDARELVVHADVAAAVEAMEAIREAAEQCRSADTQVWTALDRTTGHDTVTVGLTYSNGLGSSVFQVTRVGSARLLVSTYGEGSLASLDAQADGVTETTGTIAPAMCVFTRTGC